MFPTFDEVQWAFLSLEGQCLRKDSWNSVTIKVNFHFWVGHGTDAPNLGLSQEFRNGWHLCNRSNFDRVLMKLRKEIDGLCLSIG